MHPRGDERGRTDRLVDWIAGRLWQVRYVDTLRVQVGSRAEFVTALGGCAARRGFRMVRAGCTLAGSGEGVHVAVVWSGDRERHAAIGAARASSTAGCPARTLLVEMVPACRGAGARPAPGPEEVSDFRAREDAVTRRATSLVDEGQLDRADRLLAGVEAEAAIRGMAPSTCASCLQAAVGFWQGRFADADAALRRADAADVALQAWRALVGWARGDAPTALEAAWATDRTMDGDCRGGPPVWLLDALLAESNSVRQGAGRPDRSPARCRLEFAVRSLLEARLEGDGEVIRSASREVRRLGADGIFRWGLGREGMNLIHAIPALLHVVHDAEDEHGALIRGCEWVRQHAGADGVAVMTDAGGRLVASDGWSRGGAGPVEDVCLDGGARAVIGPSGAIVGAPVRYHGRTIGTVVARSATARVETVQEAVATLASLCAPTLRARLDAILARDGTDRAMPELVGSSAKIAAVREAVVRAAGTTFPVLIEGESGTGKELVARAVHRLSPRRDRRCAAVNCAALTDELVEAELFGYVRGAFTGAVGVRVGLFEDASGGTLFLDEIGELSLRAQAKLLRAVQEREIRRLGENTPRPIDVRLVAATNRPLADAAAHGQFRSDLLFRLSVVRIDLPPLRERIEDVPLLAGIFWHQALAGTGKHALLSPDLLAALCRLRWPGNVRELQNVMAALSVIAPARGRVTLRHLGRVLTPAGSHPLPAGVSLERARWLCERQTVAAALARHAGRRTLAARELGLTRQGLVKAIRRLGLGRTDGKAGVA